MFFFFISVQFFWFEIAWMYFTFSGVKKCPNIDIRGKIFKGLHHKERLTPPRGAFITICYTPLMVMSDAPRGEKKHNILSNAMHHQNVKMGH